MKREQLTVRQAQLMGMITTMSEHNGFPPSRRELAAEMGVVSVQAVASMLAILARKGYVEIAPKVSRGIRVLPASQAAER